MESIFKRIALGLLTATLIAGCNKKSDDKSPEANTPEQPAAPPPNVNVAPAEITNEAGCLDIPTYLKRMQDIGQSTPILSITTDIAASSRKISLHPNFLNQQALNSFAYEEKPVAEMAELWPMTQKDCDSLTFTKPDGTQEEFKILQASKSDLNALGPKGEKFLYRYISPNAIQITSVFHGPDHCKNNPEATIELTRVYDWSGNRPEIIPQDSHLMIQPRLLEIIANTVGMDVNQLFTPPEEGRGLIVSKVKEMVALPARRELITCNPDIPDNPTPNPPPTDPNPPVDPNQPANPTDPSAPPDGPTSPPDQPTPPAVPQPEPEDPLGPLFGP